VGRIVNPRAAWLVLTLSALAGTGGCSAMRPAAAKSSPPAPPTPPTVIALLPDPESGITGRARVSNEFGAVNLSAPRSSTIVNAGHPPGPVTVMSDAEVKRLFAGVLAALPPEPKHFTLYFKFESDALTDESSQKVPEILNAVKRLSVPEVVVVGHTDTLGDASANIALGLKRAMTVLNVLVEAGIARTMIAVASHGEADQLIKTRNNVAEPRNRRVEISVR
jgi:outer membrane protein OmpA-like peptidoglycan-associated protein